MGEVWPKGDNESARRIRGFDWSATLLGPLHAWPQSLKTVVDLLLPSGFPAVALWGRQLIQIYNDGYRELMEKKHPAGLGQPARECRPEAWPVDAPIYDRVWSGETVTLENALYPVTRLGRPQNAWFTLSYSPLRDEGGTIAGILVVLFETTVQHLAEERRRSAEGSFLESEARHRLLIESWAQAVWETDANGVVVADSPSWRAYTGQTLEEWLGYGWLDAIHPDDRVYAERQWREKIAVHGLVDAEFRLRAHDGDWRWTNVRAAPVLDAAGHVERWVGMNIDVTVRKRAEVALRESEEHHRMLFETMDEAYAVVEVLRDEDGTWSDFRFLNANPAFMEHTSMPNPVGRTATELLGSPNPRWAQLYGQALDTGKPLRVQEVELTLGRTFDLNIFSLDHDRNRVAVLFTDITARLRAEAALIGTELRQSFLLRLSDVLRPIGDPAEIQRTATRMLGEHLKASRVFYVTVEGDGDTADVLYGYTDGVPSRVGRYVLSAFSSSAADDWRAGRIASTSDANADPRYSAAEREACASLSTRAGLGVPLIKEGRLVALLGVDQAEPRQWTGYDTDLAGEVAERTWAALERARAEAALRESEARLEAVFEAMPAGVVVADVQGRTVMANPRLQRFLPNGVSPSMDEERGWRWRAWDVQGVPVEYRNFPGARALRGETIVPGLEMLYTEDNGNEVWTSVAATPIRNERGEVIGQVGVISDIDVLKRNVEVLRESEERLRQFGEASQDILWLRDAETLQWIYLTPAFEAIYGLSREEALRGNSYQNWQELILPEDRAHAVASIDRVIAGEWVTFEYRVRRPADGQVRWLRNTDFPIRDRAGRVVRIGGVGHDVTALKATEAALAAAEARQRLLLEGIPQLVWRAVDSGHWTWASPQWIAYTGQAEADSHDWGWLDPIHPEDRGAAREAWAHAEEAGGFAVEIRIRGAAQGEYRWFQTRAAPVRDAAGGVVEWLGTSTDIHDMRMLQERQKVLVTELQHRTRNLIAVVQATANKTLRASADLDEFRDAFRNRLEALSRVQSLLSRLAEDDRVTFDELIGAEMAALDGAAERVTLSGPPGVRLRSSMVQTLAMALHELATNALKYGALGQPQGRLTVSWALRQDEHAGEPWLHIDWRESGVAMPSARVRPAGSGQGRGLIERALPYQFGARTTYVLGPDGVHCTIEIPVSSSRAGLDERHG